MHGSVSIVPRKSQLNTTFIWIHGKRAQRLHHLGQIPSSSSTILTLAVSNKSLGLNTLTKGLPVHNCVDANNFLLGYRSLAIQHCDNSVQNRIRWIVSRMQSCWSGRGTSVGTHAGREYGASSLLRLRRPCTTTIHGWQPLETASWHLWIQITTETFSHSSYMTHTHQPSIFQRSQQSVVLVVRQRLLVHLIRMPPTPRTW